MNLTSSLIPVRRLKFNVVVSDAGTTVQYLTWLGQERTCIPAPRWVVQKLEAPSPPSHISLPYYNMHYAPLHSDLGQLYEGNFRENKCFADHSDVWIFAERIFFLFRIFYSLVS